MHDIEPYYNWQYLYNSETDPQSPYCGTVHSEFTFSNTVYNYYVHPQWDAFGSEGLYLKILFVDYDDGYCVIEFIGEWNDVLLNDSMLLKRNIIDILIKQGITKFICVVENVMALYAGPEDYYEEWQDDIADEGGYIVWLNLSDMCTQEFKTNKLRRFVWQQSIPDWRTGTPQLLLEKVEAGFNLFLK
jgi:hypothetical protein